MALRLNEEQQLLQQSAAGLLADHFSIANLRDLRDQPREPGFDEKLWQQMVAMGWSAITIDDAYGGLGFGHVGLGKIGEQIGRSLCVSPFLGTSVFATTFLSSIASEAQKHSYLSSIAAGEMLMTVAFNDNASENAERTRCELIASADHFLLSGEKEIVVDAPIADKIIVLCQVDENLHAAIVDSKQDGVKIKRLQLVDSQNYGKLSLNEVKIDATDVMPVSQSQLEYVIAVCNIHISSELLGICLESFDRTNDYLKQRQQFGIQIGMFQALQHRAAHLWSELELAKSLLLGSLVAIDEDSTELLSLASACKAKLSQIAELATNEAIQMHGGIGMTDEFEIGFFIKRARVLQSLFGGIDTHLARFAELNSQAVS